MTPSWAVYRLACQRLLPWLRVTFAMVPDAAWPGSDQWLWSTAPATGVSLIRPYSCNTRILPYPAVSCRILSYPAVSCRILPYPAVSCRILPYPAVSCRICRILPYPAVSCRILPYASNRNPNPNPNLNPNCNPNLEFQLLVKVS